MNKKICSATSLAFVASLSVMSANAQNDNPDCSSGFSSDRVIGENVVTDEAIEGWVPQRGDVLDFSADGEVINFRGEFGIARTTDKLEGIWGLTETCEIDIQYVSGPFPLTDSVFENDTSFAERYGFDQSVAEFFVNAGIFTVFLEEELLSQTMTKISSGIETDAVSVRSIYRYTFDQQFLIDSNWVGEAPVGRANVTEEKVLYAADSLEGVLPDNKKISGSWSFAHKALTSGLDNDEESINAELFSFQRKGNQVKGLYSGESYRWSQSGSELRLFNEEEAYVIKPFATDGTVYSTLTTHFVNGEVDSKYVTWAAKVKGSAVNFPARLVKKQPNISISRINSWSPSSFDENGEFLPLDIFGYGFKSDGSMGRVIGIDGGFDCIDTSSPCFFFEPSDWTWNTSIAQVTLNLSRENQERKRTWDVLSSSKGRTVVMESAFLKFDINGDGDFDDPEDINRPRFPTRINIFTTKDPSEITDAWFNSKQPATLLKAEALNEF